MSEQLIRDSYPFPFNRLWELHEATALACLLEASAPKIGNVHPSAAFADTGYEHFLASSLVVSQCFEEHSGKSARVGQMVFDAVEATRRSIGRNTNLGTILLLAPLVKSLRRILPERSRQQLQTAVSHTLRELDHADSQLVYSAIRLSNAGGLGTTEHSDVAGNAPEDLVAAMSQVSAFDGVARQYVSDFRDIFDDLAPKFEAYLASSANSQHAVCRLQMHWLAHQTDGLIERKVGRAIALEVQSMAANANKEVEALSIQQNPMQLAAVRQLDAFLRADSNRRNPGTTADLIAATLFIVLTTEPYS